jgi:uncharacterized membrane protein
MKSSWMLVAAALFALMSVLVKHASATFSPAELVFYRSAFGLLAIWGVIAVSQRRLLAPLATPHFRAHFWRGLSGFAALVLFFYALSRLPLATAVTLNYTAPLFLAALSAWWLREHHGRGVVGAVLLGFVGIVLLLRPQVEGQAWLPALAGLASGMLAAVAYVNVKNLGRLGDPSGAWCSISPCCRPRWRVDGGGRISPPAGERLAVAGRHRRDRHGGAAGADARLPSRPHAHCRLARLHYGGVFGLVRCAAVRRTTAIAGLDRHGSGGGSGRVGGARVDARASRFAIVGTYFRGAHHDQPERQ